MAMPTLLFARTFPSANYALQRGTRVKIPAKGQLTDERIATFDALGFDWTTQEYVTRSFDERIDDLEKYKQTHGHLNVKIHEDNSLSQFCTNVRYSRKKVVKNGTKKLTEERIARLDALGFEWTLGSCILK
jgi:hypothetical protein